MRPLVVLVSPSLDEAPAPASPSFDSGTEPAAFPLETDGRAPVPAQPTEPVVAPPKTLLRISPPAPPLGVRPAFVPPTGLLDHSRASP